jgi:hypothetical protein
VVAYRDLLREDLEQMVFIAHVENGGIIQVNKDGELDSYWFITGGYAYWLADDFAGIVRTYFTESHTPGWLVEQIEVLSVS